MTAPLLCICLTLLLASWNVAATSGNSSGVNSTVALPDGVVRLWLDAGFFSDGELSILKDIATTSSNRLAVVAEVTGGFLSIKGAYVPDQWDVYWTVRRTCHSVLGAIAPPKRVNCVPGVETVAYKQPLVKTMQEAYGEGAFSYIPRSYMLPAQYWVWRAWSASTSSPLDMPWVLKANAHRGRGVRVLRQSQAQRLALQGGGSADGGVQASYVLVQSYVQRQFMYEQRPSYLRLWAVVTGVQPLRVYLFRGGVLVFGDPVGSSRGGSGAGSGAGGGRRWGWGSAGRRVLLAQQEEEEEQAEDAEAGNGGVSAGDGLPVVQRSGGEQQRRRRLSQQAGGGGGGTAGGRYEMHQVNYWTIAGRKMAPWTLSQLREHISKALPDDPRVFDRMWGQARASVGMVLAAGSGAMRGAARRLAALEGSGFEVLGIDFLLNATFHPTLVEVNAVPSMARLRTGPEGGASAAAAATAAGGGASASSSTTTSTASSTEAGAAGSGAAGAAGAVGGGASGAGGAGETQTSKPAFDSEKERFMEHMVRLIGVPLAGAPLGPEGMAAAGGLGSSSSSSGGGVPGAEAEAVTVGTVLRSLAAILRPPNNETVELQQFMRRHYPGSVAAAEGLVVKVAPMLCPVPREWGPAPGWPVLPDEVQGGAGSGVGSGSGNGGAGGGGGAVGRRLAEGGRGVGGEGRGGGGEVMAAADAAARAARAAGWPDLAALQERRLGARRLTVAAGSAGAGAGAGGAAGAGGDAGGSVGCGGRCLQWDALSMLADTHREVEQGLNFDPVFPMAPAKQLNAAALQAAARMDASSKGVGAGGDASGAAGAGGTAGLGSVGGVEGGRGGGSGLEVEGGTGQTALQRLQTGWGFVRDSFDRVDFDLVKSMKYMTTTPYVAATKALPYETLDGLLASYVAVQMGGGMLSGVDGAGGEREGSGGKLVCGQVRGAEAAACAVRLLRAVLEHACSDPVAN